MSFLSQEIEDAYYHSRLITEGNFALELKARAKYPQQQKRYERLRLMLNDRQMALVDAYLEHVGAELELTEMHFFQEGWLACEQQKTAEVT